MIGYEFEFLVREGDRPLSKEAFLKFHKKLKEDGWKPKYDPGTGGLTGSEKAGFFVTSDDGVCIMEINTPPRETINECHEQINKLLQKLQSFYTELDCSIIGLGTFPGFFDIANSSGCGSVCKNNYCCEKSYIKYFNAQRFTAGHHALFIIAGHQAWLDVEKKQLMPQWRMLNAISPLLMALFANGPVLNNKKLDDLEGRDFLWKTMLDSSCVQSDRLLFGMPERQFDSLTDYFNFILDQPFYFGLRDGKGFCLHDKTKTYRDFLTGGMMSAVWFDGTSCEVLPDIDDFVHLQVLTFPHVRIKYRMNHGVKVADVISACNGKNDEKLLDCFSNVFLECRAISAQPQSTISAGPALLCGLQENFAEAEEFVKKYPYELWKRAWGVVLKRGLRGEIEEFNLVDACRELIFIARRGLEMRGYGEEEFLEPLEERVAQRENPATEALAIWKNGGLANLWRARDFVKN